MPELDIHIRLASLEADVAALRNFITAQFGFEALPAPRVDHPSIVRAPEATPIAIEVEQDTQSPPTPAPGPVSQPL